MLSFELTAIDLILGLAVIVLLILYLAKLNNNGYDENYFKKSLKRNLNPKRGVLYNKESVNGLFKHKIRLISVLAWFTEKKKNFIRLMG